MPTGGQPSEQELNDFLLGRTSDERAEELGRLIDASPDLQRTLQGAADSTDEVMAALRQAIPPRECVRDAGGLKLIERLRSLPDVLPETDTEIPTVPLHVLRDYRLLERLGRGGMGTVYKAVHTQLEKTVAIKILPPEWAHHPAAVARFRREMKAVGQLHHPNIVNALDAGECDGVLYLVMEFVDGVDLDRFTRRHGPLAIGDACEIIRQASLGLEHLRLNGFVHRDVKPSNLILGRDGRVKLVDLGLALVHASATTGTAITAAGKVMGTLDYMAPEQFENAHAVTTQSDLYSLGCTLYFLLAGRAPFDDAEHASPVRKMAGHTRERPPRLKELRPDVPAPLEDIIERLIAKDPTDRFATPGELAAVLEQWTSDSKLAAKAWALDVKVAPRPRWGRPLSVVAGLAAAILLAAGFYAWHARGPDHLSGVAEANSDHVIDKGEVPDLAPRPPKALTLELDREPNRRPIGEPLNRGGLVSRPVPLNGVVSWTLETRVHRTAVRRIAWRPDGKVLATACVDGSVRFWDVQARTLIKILMLGDDAGRAIAWSPDGRYFAATTADHSISITDVNSGCRVRTFRGHNQSVRGLGWSNDGRWLASSSIDGTARVWDVSGGVLVKQHDLPSAAQSNSLAWHPLGRLLAIAADKSILVVDAHGGKLWSTLEGHTGPIMSLAWSPDQRLLASGSQDATIRLWNTRTYYQLERVLPGHGDTVSNVAWSPDSGRLASCGGDHSVALWNPRSGTCEANLPRQSFVSCVAWSPDGHTLAYSNWRHIVRLWDTSEAPAAMLPYTQAFSVRSLAWSVDGTQLAVGGEDHKARVWQPRAGRAIAGETLDAGIVGLAWTRDGDQFRAACFEASLSTHDGRTARMLGQPLAGLRFGVPIVFAPDGQRLAWMDDRKKIQLADVTGGNRRELDFGNSTPMSIGWSPGGERLAVGTDDKCIRIFAPATGKLETALREMPAAAISLAWSPDRRLLAFGAEDTKVRLCDVDSGKLVRELGPHDGFIKSVAWSPDGKRLIAGDMGGLRLWQTSDWIGQVVRREADFITPADWSPDGTRVAYGVWGTNLVRVVRMSEAFPSIALFALGTEPAMAISDTGHVSGPTGWEDNFVYVVETMTGQEMLTPSEFSTKYGFRNDPALVRLTENLP
jgi:WD40 repeat protein/serine/threonine protein kinase